MAVVSGGTTLIDNGALDAAVPTGSLVLLSTQTASASASIEFTSGIDSTYDSYVFKFIDIHPSVENPNRLTFQTSLNNGSSYGVTLTTTSFFAVHDEADIDGTINVTYSTASDLAQSTNFQYLSGNLGADNDQSCSGELQLFNPSSSVYVKHFISRTNTIALSDYTVDGFFAGYFNTTSAINAIKFQMLSGNIDDGIIKMYGVK